MCCRDSDEEAGSTAGTAEGHTAMVSEERFLQAQRSPSPLLQHLTTQPSTNCSTAVFLGHDLLFHVGSTGLAISSSCWQPCQSSPGPSDSGAPAVLTAVALHWMHSSSAGSRMTY